MHARSPQCNLLEALNEAAGSISFCDHVIIAMLFIVQVSKGQQSMLSIDGPRSDFQMLHASHARLGSVWDSTRLRKHFHTQRPVPVPKQATYAARAAQSGYRRGFRMGRDSVCTAYSPYKSLRTLAGCHDSMYDAKEYQHCKIVDPSLQA